MGRTIVKLDIVPIDHAADALMDLEVAPATPYVGRKPGCEGCISQLVYGQRGGQATYGRESRCIAPPATWNEAAS